MLRWSCTLRMRPHFEDIQHAPTVAYPRNARPVWGHPACPEGRARSEFTFGGSLSRTFLGVCTIGMRPHLEAIPHAPRVVYPRNARSV